MSRSSITESSLAGLRPVGVGGRRALDSWDQVTGFLRYDSELGPECADLFAEPVTEGEDLVEWYVERRPDEPLVAASELDEPERERLKARAAELVARIRRRAKALQASGNTEQRRLGETILSALFMPEDRELLYAVGGRPVLIHWGLIDDTPDPALGILADYLRPKPASSPPAPEVPDAARAGFVTAAAPAVVDRRRGWWNLLWLLFAALVGLIMYWLLVGCAVGPPGGFAFLAYCPGRAMAASDTLLEEQRRADLQEEIDRLELHLARMPPCPAEEPEPEPVIETTTPPPPSPPPPPEEEEEEEPPPDDFDERLEEAGGETGAVTVTLIWEGDSDLDLIVVCPDGRSIVNYNTPSSCGGRLDVDANAGADRRANPVENVFWPEGAAQPGEYQVQVDNYEGRSAGSRPVPFRVRLRIGEETRVHDGAVAPPGRGEPVTTFRIE